MLKVEPAWSARSPEVAETGGMSILLRSHQGDTLI